MSEDGRITRLLDYTKFHIGIYLSSAGVMVTLVAAAADGSKLSFIRSLFAAPWALAVAAVFMTIAGAAGGIIASSCTQCRTFEELWNQRQGPHTLKLLKGCHWALVEHGSFWISCLFLAYSVLSSITVCKWLFSPRFCGHFFG